MMRHSHRLTATLLCVALFGGVAAAQFGRGRGGRARFASDADFDGRFNFCRLMYTSVLREEGGAGWWTDSVLENTILRFSSLASLLRFGDPWPPSPPLSRGIALARGIALV